jgi:hypothetical protein
MTPSRVTVAGPDEIRPLHEAGGQRGVRGWRVPVTSVGAGSHPARLHPEAYGPLMAKVFTRQLSRGER